MSIKVNHDGAFDIAIGRSRKETHWKNKEITWSGFLTRISQTHRTAETLREYKAEKKMRQDEIKDIGGFVGGYINGGRRKSENILHRQLLTLDIDFGEGDMWEEITMVMDCACAIYTTHKHTSENPRLRVLIPLDRPVNQEEYVAIGRRVAGTIGIDYFDDTTYEPARLMYWPSTSKDGEYLFEYQDAEWLSADEVLDSYKNWQNVSEWPTSSRMADVVKREIKKQGDPIEKQGLIGAFCRTYTISEVIDEYLSDVYTECDVPDRYTYSEGSTGAGVVVYDDKFAFSHHGTDPASGKLCNAFDLVRIHLFGLKDEDAKEGTIPTKLPSYEAMTELASKDRAVKGLLAKERIQSLREDFGFDGDIEDGEEELQNGDWQADLDVDKKGVMKGTIQNYELILRSDPRIKDAVAYNEFANTLDVMKPLPWRDKSRAQWSDADDAALRSYVEKRYETLNRSNLMDALTNVFEGNRYHPIRDYLNGIKWDGVKRLDSVFIDYMGVEDNAYTRAVTRKSLVAAVKRIFEPGCKYDNVLVLIGRQGVGKSTVLNKLGGAWFSDNFRKVDGKESVEQIQGVWIMEIGELAGLKKAEVETIKNYISTREDRCRLAYAKRVDSFPRQCVFFGTSNTDDFLRDATGNRRFWPLDTFHTEATKDVHYDLDDYEVAQIWAEAVIRYKEGEKLYLSKEIEKFAGKVQEAHSEVDERTGVIKEYLDMKLPEDWKDMDTYQRRSYVNDDDDIRAKGGSEREVVSIIEIWAELFGQKVTDLGRQDAASIRDVLRKLGWAAEKKVKKIRNYGVQRVFSRGNNL